jgi:hypothetical protein
VLLAVLSLYCVAFLFFHASSSRLGFPSLVGQENVIATGLEGFLMRTNNNTRSIISKNQLDIIEDPLEDKSGGISAGTVPPSGSRRTIREDFSVILGNTRANDSLRGYDVAPNIWDESLILPSWIKEYFAWHKQQRPKITPENWKDFRYCVMRCLDTDSRCGGTADRIKTVPLVIYWAARTKRIFMIYWSRPVALEEFLLPPAGGIDWRVPEWLVDHVVHGWYAGNVDAFEKFLEKGDEVALRSRLQSYNGGSLYYNEHVEGPKFEVVYHDVWKTLFTPSLPVQRVIREKLKQLRLRPGHYAAAHLRGLYARKDRNHDEMRKMAENAVRCATNLRPRGPIYFASDSKIAVDHIGSFNSSHARIVVIRRNYEPLHLEKADHWQNRSASEYYDTFIDLYLLGLSCCVSYNVGGYGQWGLWISRNSSCFNTHGSNRQTFHCNWIRTSTLESAEDVVEEDGDFLFPPMEETGASFRAALSPQSVLSVFPSVISNRSGNSDWAGGQRKISIDSKPWWEASKSIPEWMKKYFYWHMQVKTGLTHGNWNNSRYLVMQCLSKHEHCGGVSDRLRPLPLMLLLAARSQRLLLIQWTRPFPLEEFLWPNEMSPDWTVPHWLAPFVTKAGPLASAVRGLVPTAMSSNVVVRTRYQSNNHGAEYFNNQTDVQIMFEEVYHDLFRSFFRPSPPLKLRIERHMRSLQLVSGEYAAAHFRALYGRNERPTDEIKRIAINAINCASELRPGGPVFFASDCKPAVDFVADYSQKKGLPVVSLVHENEPLHLDKALDWENRTPVEYYPTFIDLFVLGNSRCVAYSSGGFGTFGLLLSFNSSCSVHYFGKRIIKDCPVWVSVRHT